jgi:hypothetical protein
MPICCAKSKHPALGRALVAWARDRFETDVAAARAAERS